MAQVPLPRPRAAGLPAAGRLAGHRSGPAFRRRGGAALARGVPLRRSLPTGLTGRTTVSETVLYDLTDGMAVITLNRPDAMNSLTAEMKGALRAALERAAEDEAVRAVLLTGSGRAF